MALSGQTLKGLIKGQLITLTADKEKGQRYKGTDFSDAFIEAIAQAVVTHIKTAVVVVSIPSTSPPGASSSGTGTIT